MSTNLFDRAERLLGPERLERLAQCRVLLFGVGGVGSWCAEALVRSGVGAITMVDPDVVVESNVNRQCPATTLTLGQPKVEAMAQRLRAINPECQIEARVERYSAETADDFDLSQYNYVVDCIDSVADKALLILRATSTPGVTLLSSMGAARKLDPSRVKLAEFWDVKGCPLAAALRSRFKRTGQFPRRKFKCVYSDEVLPAPSDGGPNGSYMPVTATWGLLLASRIITNI